MDNICSRCRHWDRYGYFNIGLCKLLNIERELYDGCEFFKKKGGNENGND